MVNKSVVDRYDAISAKRSESKTIAFEMDYRRADTGKSGDNSTDQDVDAALLRLLNQRVVSGIMSRVETMSHPKVVELGCGAGWLSLEMARHGAHVTGIDISPKMLSVANQMKKDNPFKQTFGSLNYKMGEITRFVVPDGSVDAFVGWETLYFADDVEELMQKIYKGLKVGGLIVTVDFVGQGRFETMIGNILELLFPSYNRTFFQKAQLVFSFLKGQRKLRQIEAGVSEDKRLNGIEFINDFIKQNFEVLVDDRDMAFSSVPVSRLGFRGSTTKMLVARLIMFLDDLLRKLGIVKGSRVFLVGRKPD